ncbi:MAG: hypothetical protein ACRDEB_10080, partial [Chitinophagaceae bacterium]
MKKSFIIIFIILLSCNKMEEEKWYQAKVINTSDPICGKPVIQFLQKDSAEIVRLSEFNTLSYKTYSLEDKYNYLNNSIFVRIGHVPEAWVGPPCSG